jgi:biotin transport system substrate-specific component
MTMVSTDLVLAEAVGPAQGTALRIKQAVLVVLGIVALTIAAQVKLPAWPSPVAVNLGTLAVLSIGAAYGPRLGLTTILAYMVIGALGFDVFQSSTAELNGITYMMGSTGGYLAGYVLATLALGLFARRGWDRSVVMMALAMLVGNVLLYVPGLAWLAQWTVATGKFDAATYGTLWNQTMAWGLTPFIVGDLMKLVVAALLFPVLWKLVGSARA